MSRPSFVWRCLVGTLVTVLLAATAQAQTPLYWDPGLSGGTTGGGGGTWDMAGTYWYGLSAGTDGAWTDTTGTATAVFGGTTAGTVTLAQATTANGLTFNTAGYYLTGSTITLKGTTPTITMNASGGTIASLVAGGSGVTITGTGPLDLIDGNTYSGGTTLSSGTLQVGNNAALGTGSVTLVGGELSSSGTTGYSLANPLVLSGSSTLGDATSSGALTFTASTGTLAAISRLTIASPVTINSVLSGSPGLMKAGTGTLTLGGLSTYTGGTTIAAGVVVDSARGTASAGGLGAFNTAVSTIVVQNGATLDIDGAANGSDFLYGVTIAGSGVSGQGALINSGANGGGGNRSTPNIALSANATLGGTGNICMINGGYAADNLTLNGFTLTKTGANTFYLCNTTVSAGTVNIAQGFFSDANSSSTATSADFVLAPATALQLNGYNLPIGSLSGSGGTVALGGNTLTVGGDNNSPSAYAGIINGSGAVTKTGTGTLLFTGGNTYTGQTTVSAGTLLLGFNASALGSNIISASSPLALGGGVLAITGSAGASQTQTVGALTLAAGVSGINLNPNGGTVSLATGNLTANGAATLYVTAPTASTLSVGNTWTQGSGATLLLDLTGGSLYSNPTNTNGIIGNWVLARDSNGTTLATVINGNQVVGSAGYTFLPASGATAAVNYWLGSTQGSQTLTAPETVNLLALVPSAAGQSLALTGGSLGLTANTVTFDGTHYAYAIGGANQLGASDSTLNLITVGSNALTIAAPVSGGTGGLNVSSSGGGGAVILAASNTFTGATSIGAGVTLQLGDGASLNGAVSGNIVNAGSLLFANPLAQSYAGVISGGGSVTKSASGSVALAGVNTYTGGTTISAGTLQLGTGSSGQDGSLASAVTNNSALVYDIAGSQTASYTISGSGSLVSMGSGNVTLNTANTFTGNVTVNAGTLTSATGIMNSNTALGKNDTVTVNSGATLVIGGVNGTTTMGASPLNTIAVSGGTLNFSLTGASGQDGPYMGAFNLNGAAVTSATTSSGPRWGDGNGNGLIATSGAASTWSAPMWLVAGGGNSLTFATSANLTVSGVIADYSSLTGLPFYKTGPAALILTGSDTYAGTTTVSGGTLQIGAGAGGSLGGGSYSAAIANSGVVVFNTTTNQTLSGVLSGTGSLVQNGPGLLTLTATSSYSGTTTVSGGTLKVYNQTISYANPLSNTSGIALNGGNFTLSTGSAANIVFATPITGSGTINIDSDPGATSVYNARVDLAGGTANTFTGTVNILPNGRCWQWSTAAQSLPSGTNINDNGLFVFGYISGNNQTIAALSGSGTVAADNAAGTLTIGYNNASSTFTGTMINYPSGGDSGGVLALVKTGSGTQILAGVNTYTGSTTISGGTLQLGTGQSGQDGSLASAVTDNSALVYNIAGSQTVNYTISGSGSLTSNGSGNVTLNATNPFTGKVTINAGTLTSATGNLNGVTALGQGNTVTVNSGAMLVIDGQNATGTMGASPSNTLTVNGGTLNFAMTGSSGQDGPYMGTFNLNGATVMSTSSTSGPRWGYSSPSGVINTSGSASTWSAPLWLVSGTGKSLTFATSANLTISGAMTDYAGLGGMPVYKTGPAALILSASDTYSGATTISGGTLQIGAGGSSGALAGNGAIVDNSVLAFSRGDNALVVSNAISGSGSLVNVGPGMVTLSAGTTNNCPTIIVSGGTLALNDGNTGDRSAGVIANAASASISVQPGATLYLGAVCQLGFGNDATRSVTVNAGTLATGNATWNYIPSLTLQNGAAVTLGTAQTAYSGSGSLWDLTTITSNGTGNTTNVISSAGGTITPRGPMTINVADRGLAASDLTIAAIIANGNAGTASLTKTGSGVLTLTASNVYTGGTTVSGGTLQLGDGALHNGSVPGNISVANNGTLIFANPNVQSYGGALSGAGNLRKTGTGFLTLSGNNAISGAANVNAGVLSLTGSLAATSFTVSSGATLTGVGNGTTTGVIAGTVTVNGGGAIDFTRNGLASGVTSTFAFGGLTVGDSSSTPVSLTFNVNTSNAQAADLINLGNGTLTVNPSGGTVNIAYTSLAAGTYPLIDYGTLAGSGSITLNPAETRIGLSTLQLVTSGNTLALQVAGNPTPTLAYWSGNYGAGGGTATWGGFNSTGPVTNWATNLAGTTDAAQIVGGVSDVVFAANSAAGPISTTLDTAYSINSLTVTTTAAVSIGGSQNLSINAGSSGSGGMGYAAGNGIVMQPAAGALLLATSSVIPAASQSWSNNSASLLTVSGNINGAAASGTSVLTLSGTGSGGDWLSGAVGDGTVGGNLALVVNTPHAQVTFSGSNSYSGGTTLSAGTLTAVSGSPLGSGPVLMNPATGTAVLALSGAAPSLGSLANGGAGVSSIVLGNAAGSTATLLVVGGNNTSTTFSGTIGDLSLANSAALGGIDKVGTGNLLLSASNTYTGGTTVDGGSITLGSAAALSTGGLTINAAGTANFANFVPTNNVAINGGTLALTGGAGASGTITLANSAGNTFTLNGNYAVLSGQVTGPGGFTVTGISTPGLALSNASNNFQGNVVVNTGAFLRLDASNVLPNSTVLTVNGSLKLSDTGATTNTFAGLSGSGTVFQGNGTPGNNTLVVGAGGVSSTFNGTLGASGQNNNFNLVKTGSGTLTLAAANPFTGSVTVNGGTLVSAAGNLNGDTALGTNNTITVNSGAMLVIQGVNGSTTMGASALNTIALSGGTLNFSLTGSSGQDGPYMGTFNLNGAAVTSANSTSGPRWGDGNANGLIATTGAASTWSAPMWLVAGSGESLTFANSANLTVSGVIADYSSLTGLPVYKTGPGTLTLSGANTYNGTTTVGAGLVINGAYSTSSGAFGTFNTAATKLVIQSGATVDINGGAQTGSDFDYGVTMAGNGSSGQGALVNNGANGNGGDRSTPNITLSANAAVGGSGSIYMISDSYGAGTLNLNGFTLTKTGTNTFYFCNTTVTAGTIDVVQGGISVTHTASNATATQFSLTPGTALTLNGFNLPIGSLTGTGGTVALGNSTLTVGGDNSSPAAFAGAIVGSSGALVKTGSGQLTLAAANTYTGGTTISGGTLQLGGGGTAGSIDTTSNLVDNGVLAFNRANNFTFALPVSGSGGVNQLGTNSVTLAGNSSYTGPTNVSAGTLVVSGTLGATAIVVAGGATLSGAGSIGGNVTVAGGSSPANQGVMNLSDGTIGALNLNGGGTLTLGSGGGVSVIDLDLGSGTTDQIAVGSGNLAMSGSVTFNFTQLNGATLSAGTYNLLSFGNLVSGSAADFSFSPIANLPTTLLASLNTTSNAERLIIAPSIPATAYWQAGTGAWSATGNWSADQGNTTPIGSLPGSISAVSFATAGGTATVDQNFAVSSLSLATSNSVTISGTGTLTLVGSAGLSDNGAAAHTLAAPVALGAAQAWTVNGTGPLTVSSIISDSSSANGTTGLTLAGAGAVIFTNANTYSGGTTLSGVTLQLGDGLSANGSVTGNIADNGLLVFANPNPQSFSGTISGTGGVAANGPSVLTFTTAHSYSGGTTIGPNSALQLGDGALANGSVTGNISDNGLLTFANPLSQSTTGTISGAGGVIKSAGGLLTLTSAANSYLGGTTVSGGTLSYGATNALPTTGAVTINNGAQLNLAGQGASTVGAVTLANGSIGGQSGDVLIGSSFNVQNGTANVVLAGSAAGLTMSGPGTVILSAANTYGGGTTVAGGLLQYGTANALPTTGAVVVSGGQLDLNGTSGGTVEAVILQSGSIAGQSNDTLYAGSVIVQSGAVSANLGDLGDTPLVKSGSGTVLLSGDNSYAGGTSVEGGVLAIAKSASLPGNLTLGAGTLQTTGHYALDASTITLTDPTAGIDTPNYSDDLTVSALIMGSGGLNKTGPGTLELANAAGNTYAGDTNVAAGTLLVAADNALSPASNLVIGDGASVILDFGGASSSGNSFLSSPSSLAAPSLAVPALSPGGIATVPEPGTLMLLLVGVMAGVVTWRRRR